MASAAEQLAANLNFGAFAKATELKKRIWFTLARSGVPAWDLHSASRDQPAGFAELFQQTVGGILGMFNMFAGGAVGRMAIFRAQYHAVHLGLDHHAADDRGVAASRALKKEGEPGRKKINQYTRYGTVLLAALQAYGIAVGLEAGRAVRH